MAKLILTLLLFGPISAVFGQTLTGFKYSDCLTNGVNYSSKITDLKIDGSITTISLKTYAPCNGNLDGGLEIVGRTVDLKFWTKPRIVRNKKGEKTEILEVADCNCMFDFRYEVKGLGILEKKAIKVNGQELKEIDARNIGTAIQIEDTVEVDSIK